MGEQIISASGTQFGLIVNSDGSINISDIVNPVINNFSTELVYITSGTSTGITTGSFIGSQIKFTDTGSFVRSLTYSNNNLINVGSWI